MQEGNNCHSKYYEMWGFDEPENSCEHALTKNIAKQFAEEYTHKTQIFVASHSFNFISLLNSKTSKYRVYKDEKSSNTNVVLIDNSNSNLLSSELGILDINLELAKLYEKLTKEMEVIDNTKTELENTRKPYLILEGKTDNELFKLAYNSLYKKSIDSSFTLCQHLESDNGASVGSGARFINEFLHNHVSKIPTNNKVIGIFDFDATGFKEINALKNSFVKLSSSNDNFFLFQHKILKNVYAMTLVAPSHRANFINSNRADYCYLSSELLFQDSEINVSNRLYPTMFDTTVFSFSGKKTGFVDKVKMQGKKVDFSGFKETFELIQKITRM